MLIGTATIFDYYSETFQLPDGSYVNCEILDTSGQEKYNALNKIYYQRADCCVLVYDITDLESFEACNNYYKEEISKMCKKDTKVILVGNKADLEKERKVSNEDGAKFAKENKYYFKETSCEKNFNVADAFETIIIMTNNDMVKIGKQNFVEKIKLQSIQNEDDDNNSIKGELKNTGLLAVKKKKKKICC